MNFKIAATTIGIFALTGCVTPVETPIVVNTVIQQKADGFIIDSMVQKQKISIENLILTKNTSLMSEALRRLNTHVDKTWYVFSGATPGGWDCSGLTMWFYEQVGISLEHRASRQDSSGVKTSDPKAGDIVVFHYKGSTDAYHVGIYIGNGKMIHAPKHGHVTRVEDISTFGGNYSNITYRRIVETL